MLRRLKRKRKSLGFGIHSPFAFRILEEIIKEKYRYYAYDEAEAIFSNQGHSKKKQDIFKVIFRLVAREEICMIYSDIASESFRSLIYLADRRISFIKNYSGNSNGILIYSSGDISDEEEKIMSVIGNYAWIENYNDRETLNRLHKTMPGGMIFYNDIRILAITRANMPLITHEIDF